MAIATFELDKSRVFVAGLFWLPLSASDDRKKESVRLAQEQSMDMAVWRNGHTHQIGLGSSTEGIAPGMMSAAAVVSKAIEVEGLGRNSLCATQIPDGRWLYVAHSEGCIIPEADFVGTEDEVRSRMVQDFSSAEWDLIFAPPHWGFEGATDRPFTDFLPRSPSGKVKYHSWWKVRPVGASASLIAGQILRKSLPVLLIAAVGIGGVWFYKNWKEKKSAEAAAQAAMSVITNTPPPKPPEHPWKSKSRAVPFTRNCFDAIVEGPIAVAGWVVADAMCQSGSLNVTLTRADYVPIEGLKQIINNATLSEDATKASVVTAVILSPGEDEAVPPQEEAIMHLRVGAQKHGVAIEIMEPAQPAPPPLPGVSASQQAAPDWRERRWKVKTKSYPMALIRALDGPGLRVDSVMFIVNSGSVEWKLEGTQYAK